MFVFEGSFAPTRPFVSAAISASRPADRIRGAYPVSVEGIMLLDTGAEQSCVRENVAHRLGLADIGMTEVSTVNGLTHAFLYRIRLTLVSATNQRVTVSGALDAIGDTSSWPAVMGGDVIGLIGMDVLSRLHLTLDGPSRYFLVAYDHPSISAT